MLKITITSPSAISKGVRDYVKQEVSQFSGTLFSELRTNTPIKADRARAGWRKKQRSAFEVQLSNTVPYIDRLENNYSKQTRGRGIMKPAIASAVARRQRRNTR